MKTILKAAACTVLTLVCALVFSTLLMNAIGMNPESVALDEYSDRMLEARSLFVEKNEDFQALAAALKEHTGLQILQTAGGEPVCMDNGEVIPAQDILSALEPDTAQALTSALRTLYEGAEVSAVNSDGQELTGGLCRVMAVFVRDWGVEFYTAYHKHGYVGILYTGADMHKPPYDLVELVEDWQIFYHMDDISK